MLLVLFVDIFCILIHTRRTYLWLQVTTPTERTSKIVQAYQLLIELSIEQETDWCEKVGSQGFGLPVENHSQSPLFCIEYIQMFIPQTKRHTSRCNYDYQSSSLCITHGEQFSSISSSSCISLLVSVSVFV